MTKTNNTSPVVTLKARAKEFDFSKLRFNKSYTLVESGYIMHARVKETNFVINGKKIDQAFFTAFEEGTSAVELYTRAVDMILEDKNYGIPKETLGNYITKAKEEKGKQTQPSDMLSWQAWLDSPISGAFDKAWEGYCVNEFDNVWRDHCNDTHSVTDDQKTDKYKEILKEFYDAGRKYGYPIEKEDYRLFIKSAFKKMFQYAGAEVPSDPIIEELITNIAGYENAMSRGVHDTLISCGLTSSSKRTLNIDCIEHNHTKVKFDIAVPITTSDNQKRKTCNLSKSLEFTLESQDGIIYKDGKLSLTIPKELKNYKEGDKNLFDIIKGYFQKFCEKLGFKFETKIEHSLGDQLKVDSHGHLDNAELSVKSRQDVKHKN